MVNGSLSGGIDLQQLRSFRSVVAEGTVRGAADLLGYSPSAVSQQISHLQRHAGVALLTPAGRGLETTAAGRALAARIDTLLQDLGNFETFVDDLRLGRAAGVSLIYFPSLGASWLPDIVGEFITRFPDIPVELRVAERFEPHQQTSPDIQLIASDAHPPVPRGYDAHYLREDPFVLAMSHQHPLAQQEAVALGQTQRETWIDNDRPGSACRELLLNACAAAGFQPLFHLSTDDYLTALSLVQRGAGVTALPALAATSLPPGVVTRPLTSPAVRRAVTALVARSSASQEPVEELLSIVRDVAD